MQDLTGTCPTTGVRSTASSYRSSSPPHPDKTKIGAGLGVRALWTVSKGIQRGDLVLCPDGSGLIHVGEVTGDYRYEPDKKNFPFFSTRGGFRAGFFFWKPPFFFLGWGAWVFS